MQRLARTLTSALLGGTLALFVFAPAQAGPPAPHEAHAGPALSFDESLGASVDAPSVAGTREAAEQKRSDDEDIPRLTKNPQLMVMPGARLPPSAAAGFELQLQLTQSWNLEGYGKKRRAAAEAETDLLDAEARARALEQRIGAAYAWIRLHAAERRLAIAEGELALARELVEALEEGFEGGVVTRVEVAESRAVVAESEAARIAVAGEVHDLGLELARETGTRASAPLRTRGDYPAPQLPSEAELREAFAELDALPEVTRHKLEARAALARAEESKASRGTVMGTGVFGQLESNGDGLLFGVINLTLPVVDRNQRQQATARAEARKAEAAAAQAQVELAAHLAVAIHDLHHTRDRMEVLRDRTLPALDELVEARRAGLAEGESTRPELLDAQHRRGAVARELAEAEADWVWARVEVWLYLEALRSGEGAGE